MWPENLAVTFVVNEQDLAVIARVGPLWGFLPQQLADQLAVARAAVRAFAKLLNQRRGRAVMQ